MIKYNSGNNKHTAPQKTEILYTVVSLDIKKATKHLASAMGISISEYVRRLILDDLDNRTFFASQFK